MSLSSSLAPREASPARSTSSSSSSPDILDDGSLIQVGSKSTIYISSSPRRRPVSPPPVPREEALPLREEAVRRSITPPVHTTVSTWRERTRAARSEVSSVFDDARSHSQTETGSGSRSLATETYTSTMTSLAGSGRTVMEIGSSTGTDVVASTLSYRRTADASLLGDSCHGTSSFTPSLMSSLRGRVPTSRGLVTSSIPRDEGHRVERDVPAHSTGSSHSGQTLSYVSQNRQWRF